MLRTPPAFGRSEQGGVFVESRAGFQLLTIAADLKVSAADYGRSLGANAPILQYGALGLPVTGCARACCDCCAEEPLQPACSASIISPLTVMYTIRAEWMHLSKPYVLALMAA